MVANFSCDTMLTKESVSTAPSIDASWYFGWMLIWQDCEHFNFLILAFCIYDQWLTFIPTSKVKIAAKKKSLESIPNTLDLVRSNSNFIYSNTITEKKVYLWKSNQLSQGNSSSHCLRQQGLLMLKIQRKPETIVNVFVRKKRKYPIFRCILLIGPKLGPEAYASSKLCEFILHQILPNGSGWAISHLINMIFLSGEKKMIMNILICIWDMRQELLQYYQDDQHDEVVEEFLGDNPMNQLPDAEKQNRINF